LPEPSRWFSIIPPKKIKRGFYICQTKFELDYLRELSEEHGYYGGILISGREAHFYLINDQEIKVLESTSMHVDKQQKKGGQSAPRIGRLRDDKKHRNCKYIAERLMHHYYDAPNNKLKVIGLILGGPGETKRQVISTDIFQKYLLKEMIYLDETSEFENQKGNLSKLVINELYQKAKDSLIKHSLTEDLEILQEILDMIDMETDLLTFGEKEVVGGLEKCLLKKVIYESKLTKELEEKLIELSKISGAELIKLKTIEGDRRLEGYGGMIGVKWFY